MKTIITLIAALALSAPAVAQIVPDAVPPLETAAEKRIKPQWVYAPAKQQPSPACRARADAERLGMRRYWSNIQGSSTFQCRYIRVAREG